MTSSHFLITGGAGFIGSHLAESLLAQGHRVTALDDLSTGRLENIAHLVPDDRFAFVQDAVTNQAVLDELASGCDVIVHLAAVVGVKLVTESVLQTISTNVKGSEAVLSAAKRHGVQTLLASTSEVYGKSPNVPFREEDDTVLGPTTHSRWVYATTKILDEFLALAYCEQHGVPTTILRFFNTVGPRQTGQYGMVMPRFVRAALAGETLQVYGDGTQTRCFCHVKDVVRAVIGLAQAPQAAGRVFNVGSSQETSILALAKRVIALLDSPSEIVLVPYKEVYGSGFEDTPRRVPDTERIRRLLGWEATYSLDDIILDIADSLKPKT
jgi:UDP-glucose 4-epimerase